MLDAMCAKNSRVQNATIFVYLEPVEMTLGIGF